MTPTLNKATVISFQCTKCGGVVEIRAPGASLSVVCRSCGSVLDPNDEYHLILSKVKQLTETVIPLGSRGILFGAEWEVIGFLEKADSNDQFTWTEFLLFNPYFGFRWLVESDGHWSFVRMIRDTVMVNDSGIEAKFHEKDFKFLQKINTKVKRALGEFYWQVRNHEKAEASDFIAPPEMLSLESNDKERMWSHGTYLEASTVQMSFGIPTIFPIVSGVGAIQPNPYPEIGSIWVFFLSIWIAMMIVQTYSYKANLLDQKIPTDASFSIFTGATNSFRVDGAVKGIEVNSFSPLVNDWMDIDYTLVNENDGSQIEFSHGLEFYQGRDEDGFWQDGSQTTDSSIGFLGTGNYHLNYEIQGAQQKDPTLSGSPQNKLLSIRVTSNPSLMANFFWVLFLFSLPCGVIFLLHRGFENRRINFNSPEDDDSDDSSGGIDGKSVVLGTTLAVIGALLDD